MSHARLHHACLTSGEHLGLQLPFKLGPLPVSFLGLQVGLFMPALCARLEALGPQERESIPLMEALTAVSLRCRKRLVV